MTATAYVHLAFDGMLAVADRLGDDRVNERPISDHTNAVGALIVHCCGVAEFWLGHVGLGRDSHRDRERGVLRARPRLGELHGHRRRDLPTRSRPTSGALDAGARLRRTPRAGSSSTVDDTSDASLVLHVIEELFQHLGHCEIAADVRRCR